MGSTFTDPAAAFLSTAWQSSTLTHTPNAETAAEVLQEGRRMLAVQERMHHTEMTRVSELLRLCVATLGGVIVIMGILVSTTATISIVGALSVATGVLGVVLASFLCAAALASPRGPGFAYGPDLDDLVSELGGLDRSRILLTLVLGLPAWLKRNRQALGSLQRRKARVLYVLASGVAAILGGLVYIIGGAMHG